MIGSYRGGGEAAYHPRLLLGILVYGYATGVFSSRKLERATYDSVAFRFIAANQHPGPRHHRRVPATLSAADRGAVRAGAAAGARAGRAAVGDGGAGWHQDPRQCEPPQRAVLRTCGPDRGAVAG